MPLEKVLWCCLRNRMMDVIIWLSETEQSYHLNKQEFLALKWAVTEQFYEYMTPCQKNKNEFVVQTDNNPLTYIFSACLDAAGH